jgi:hypothetical protein
MSNPGPDPGWGAERISRDPGRVGPKRIQPST